MNALTKNDIDIFALLNIEFENRLMDIREVVYAYKKDFHIRNWIDWIKFYRTLMELMNVDKCQIRGGV